MHERSRRATLLIVPMVMSVAVCERSGHQPPRSPYPAALYARKAQGNVTLRLFVGSDGRAAPDIHSLPVHFRHPEARPLPGDTILTIAEAPISGAQPKVGENKR
jgi:hypothetical protein